MYVPFENKNTKFRFQIVIFRKSVQLCQELEAAGVSFLTVHGRTVKQRNDDVNLSAIKDIVDSVRVPVIGNGGIKNLDDAQRMADVTNCKG